MLDDLNTLAGRFSSVRKHMGFNQELFAKQTGIPKSTIQKYEGGHREPGSDALAALSRMGINVNWLLTGVGEMLLATPTAASEPSKSVPRAQINEDALIAAFVGMMQVAAPGETPKQTATKAIQFYKYLLEQEMITPDGIGKGKMGNAA